LPPSSGPPSMPPSLGADIGAMLPGPLPPVHFYIMYQLVGANRWAVPDHIQAEMYQTWLHQLVPLRRLPPYQHFVERVQRLSDQFIASGLHAHTYEVVYQGITLQIHYELDTEINLLPQVSAAPSWFFARSA
jgi:hypothetical protein